MPGCVLDTRGASAERSELTEQRVQDFEKGASLHPLCELAILIKYALWAVGERELDGAREDGGPGAGGQRVVEDEVTCLGGVGWWPGLGGRLLFRRHDGQLRMNERGHFVDVCSQRRTGVGVVGRSRGCWGCDWGKKDAGGDDVTGVGRGWQKRGKSYSVGHAAPAHRRQLAQMYSNKTASCLLEKRAFIDSIYVGLILS